MQGNMLSDGDRQYSYDVRNRLAEVRTADGSWQKNHYYGEGLRAELEENGRLVRFIYDGDRAVLEGTDENTIRHIRGYELVSSDSEAAKTYYHYASDELGSITHVTDGDGNVLNRYEYDAFGNFTLKEETVENRFGFAGEQYDPAANLYYLRARFYNPVIGRFIQEDTYYGDGLNLYTYCHNNPVGYVDPSGHTTWDCPNKQTAIQYLTDNGMSEQEARNKYDEIRKKSGSAEEARKRITGEYNDPGDRTRLPRNNGRWEGEAGNGIWHSDIEEVNAITGGKGIPFKDGRPDFSEWSQMDITFAEGILNGSYDDFGRVYEYLAQHSNGQFASGNAAREWLREQGLTPHHYSNTVIQLIPTDLHANIPHIGSASDLRRSLENE